MSNLKQRFNRYSLAEWIVFILGVVILCAQTYRYITNTLEGTLVDLAVFAASFLCLFAPKALVGIIKNKSDG